MKTSLPTNTLSCLFAGSLLIGLAGGCSSNPSVNPTVTKTEVIHDDSTRASYRDDGSYRNGPDESRHSRTETVKTSETAPAVIVKEDEPHGFFEILGDIVALPFRAVGGFFRAIF